MQATRNTQPAMPCGGMTATQQLQWFAAHGIKGTLERRMRGQELRAYSHLQTYADGSVAPTVSKILAVAAAHV